jgi:hypothetical protein
MIVDNGKYYLYRHIRLDTNEPFYIGIGTKDKNYKVYQTEYRRAFSLLKRNTYWKRISNKTEYKIEILLESDDYKFIKQKEVEFIKLHGRFKNKGLLCNMTDGGDGTHGFNRTPEINKQIGLKITGTLNKKSKTCYQYNKEGVLINSFGSFSLASKILGFKKQNLLEAKNNNCLSNNYYWSDKMFNNWFIDNYEFNNKPKIIYKGRLIVAVKNDIIYEFYSIVQAALFFTGSKTNKSNIKLVLNKTKKTAYGFSFNYK